MLFIILNINKKFASILDNINKMEIIEAPVVPAPELLALVDPAPEVQIPEVPTSVAPVLKNFGYDCKRNKPLIEFIVNNGTGRTAIQDLKCLNFIYQRHEMGKYVWNYTCRVPGCKA